MHGSNNQQQYCTGQTSLIFDGYLNVRESLLLFGPIPFYNILVLGLFCLRVNIIAWYIDSNGVGNKISVKNVLRTTTKEM